MPQPGGGRCFPKKPLDAGGIGESSEEKQLQGDGPLQAPLPRTINHAHPAMTDFGLDLIVPESFRTPRSPARLGSAVRGQGNRGVGRLKGFLEGQ